METINLVKEFHKTFVRSNHSRKVLIDLRLNLLKEELKELEIALEDDDDEAILDALTDLQYVLDGAYIAFGFDTVKNDAFLLVHDANMKKLDSNGKPIIREDGKIVKPEGWKAPDLSHLLPFDSWFSKCEKLCISQAEWVPDITDSFWQDAYIAKLSVTDAVEKFFEKI